MHEQETTLVDVDHRSPTLPGGRRLSRRAALHLAAAAGGVGLLATRPSIVTAVEPAAPRPPAQSPDDRFSGLDEAVRAAMAEAAVPGAALGVLYQGQEYVAGFGVTNADYPQPVDGIRSSRSARSARRLP